MAMLKRKMFSRQSDLCGCIYRDIEWIIDCVQSRRILHELGEIDSSGKFEHAGSRLGGMEFLADMHELKELDILHCGLKTLD